MCKKIPVPKYFLGLWFVFQMLCVCPSHSVAAGIFFIDGSSANCSPTGPGTEENPFCSITAALNAVAGPGTTLYVKPGFYREQVLVPASGSAGNPLVIEALDGPVVVDGADDYSGSSKWTQNAGNVWYVSGVSTPPLEVFKNGIRLSEASGGVKSIPANTFQYESKRSRLHVNVGGGNPGVHQILVGARNSGFILTGRSWVEIRGFTVTRAQQRGIVVQGGSSNLTLAGNTVTSCLGYGVHVDGGSAHRLSANTVSDNGDHGIMVSGNATGCRVEDNECFRNVFPTQRRANGIHGLGSSSNRFERNRLHDNDDSGLELETGANNNLCIQNIAWGNGGHGFDQVRATGNLHIGDVACLNAQDGFSVQGSATGTRLINCIAVNNGVATSGYDLRVDAGSTAGFASDYNTFWNAAGHVPVSYGGSAYASVADYAAAAGKDAHSFQDDPRFANPSAGDFHLLAGSRAIDSAHSGDANWPATDAQGRARFDDPGTPDSGVGLVPYADRGALEFVAPGTPPIATLSVTPSSGPAPLTVTADASGSSDPDGTITSYRFDFGDGSAVGPQAGVTADHTYAVGGSFVARVTVLSSDGGTAVATQRVDVNASNQPPNGTIDAPPGDVTILAGQSVSFSGSGSDPDGNLPLGYAWNFGGGAPSQTSEDPGSVTFNGTGRFTVTLTVSDALRLADPTPATRVITVNGTGAEAGTADEIHWTVISQTAVSFDWRGTASSIRYGTTAAFGQAVAAINPSPAPFSSAGPFWDARIAGLQENTLYYYSIGGGPTSTFRTPPPRGSSGFVAYAEGDIGDSVSYRRVVACQTLIANAAPDLMLGLGDMTYGNAHGLAAVDNHFNDVMKWSRTSPYMPAWGNHEWDAPTRDDLRNYKGRFDLPNPQASPGAPAPGCCGEDWFWYDYGNTRFIIYPEPYASATWTDWQIRAAVLMDQAQADPEIRWIVTYGHRPAYSSGHHPGATQLKNILDALGDTHSKYVLNLNGHSHNYERSYPQHGVVHVTAGAGGSTLEEDGTCLWLTCAQPSWSAYRAMHHSVVRLVFGASSLAIEAICGPAGDTGSNRNDITCTQETVFDRYVIGTESADRAPLLVVPASLTVAENQPVILEVTASDPDGDAITSLSANLASLPAGHRAVFTPGAGNAAGTLMWTPTYDDAGSYTVTCTARNSLVTSQSTVINVVQVDRAPVTAAPATATGAAGARVTVNVTALDPDGDPITSLTVDARGLPAPNDANFIVGSGNTTGAFTWTPALSHFGTWTVRFRSANALAGPYASTAITVGDGDRAPDVLATPARQTVDTQQPVTVEVTASDPDGDPISSLAADTSSLPAGHNASFAVASDNRSGILRWTPSASDTGTFVVTFTAVNTLTGSASAAVIVSSAAGDNLCGNPSFETSTSGWAAYQGTAIAQAASATAHHGAYVMRMTAPSVLRGNDGINDTPSWVITTAAAGTRYRFTAWVRSATSTSLSGLQMREYLNGVRVGSIILSPTLNLAPSWQMLSGDFVSGAAGSYIDFQVMATPVAPLEEFETDDITIRRVTTSEPPVGSSTHLERVELVEDVSFAPVVTPNPTTGSAMLSFVLSKPGPLTIRIYDTTGRMVRMLANRSLVTAGRHAVSIAGPDAGSQGLRSGIYHYRIDAPQGVRTGRFAMVR